MEEKACKPAPKKPKKKVTISYEVITNILGSLFYECKVCDQTVDNNLVEIHAVEKHGATHLNIMNAPIASQK